MDLLRFQIIIRIYLNSRRPIGLSTVSIPDRDFVNLQAFIGSYYRLQVWAGRQKRLSTASEVSIPDRDFSLPIGLEANPLFLLKHCTRFGCRWSQGKVFYGLPKLNYLRLCYHSHQGWLQGLSTGTETRWTAFLLFSDVTYTFLWLKASIHKKYWRFRQMDKQFEAILQQLGLLTKRIDEQDRQIDYLVRKLKQNESVMDGYENRYYEWECSETYYSLDGDANCNS
jgi:hypothetical protein